MKPPNRRRINSPLGGLARGLLLIVVFAALAVVAALLEPLPPVLSGPMTVADGDTLRLGRDRIRLTGLDAPELDQTCADSTGADWPCGRVSREQLRALIGGGDVSCTTSGKDRYGRFLGRCMTDGRDLGARLVSEGLAVADPPNYRAEEALAQREKRGLWAGAFDPPRQWRDSHGDTTSGFDLLGWIRSWFG